MAEVLLILVVVLVGWACGLLGSLRKTVAIGNREIDFRNDQHAVFTNQRYADMGAEAVTEEAIQAQQIRTLLRNMEAGVAVRATETTATTKKG